MVDNTNKSILLCSPTDVAPHESKCILLFRARISNIKKSFITRFCQKSCQSKTSGGNLNY